MITKKQQLFIRYYTDKTDETYGNGTKAVIKAGYSEKRADNTAYKLLQKGEIRREIQAQEKADQEEHEKDKMFAIVECRRNYELARDRNDTKMMKYWYDKWTFLKGWDIQKSHIETTDKTEEKKAQLIHDALTELAKKQKEAITNRLHNLN